LDPAASGWPSEAFAEAAGGRLDALGKLLSSARPPSAGALSPLLDPHFATGPLRPAALAEVFGDGHLTVRRAARTAGDGRGPELKGAAGFASALAALSEPFAGGEDLRTEFQMVGVEWEEGRADTTILFHRHGRSGAGRAEQSATWHARWTISDDGSAPRLASLRSSGYEEIDARAAGPLFSEATEAVLGTARSFREQLLRGVDHWLERTEAWIESDGFGHHGLALGDVNGDGLDDLYVCQMGGLPNLLYVQNPDGTVTDRSVEAGVDWLERTRSALFADFDNDGDQDLVAATSVSLLFMANDGTGRFEPRSSLSIVNGVVSVRALGSTRSGGAEGGSEGGHYHRGGDLGASSTSDLISLAAADYDQDGLIDLYACAYHASSEEATHFATPAPYHDANNGGPNILLRNKGGWAFEDVTRSSGLDVNNRRFSFAAVWEDDDNDGDQDLYVANDFGRKNLYRNDGGRFRDVAPEMGVEDVGAGMSADWADYDRDGLMDLYVGNMFTAAGRRIAGQRAFRRGMEASHLEMYRRHARGNSLFRNLGGGRMADVSEEAGVTMGRWAWASKWADLNNDGWDDLFITNGYFTKENPFDLAGFFWRRVVMQSPDHPVEKDEARHYAGAWRTLGRMIRHGWSFAGRERKVTFLNTGTGRFAMASGLSGLDLPDDARAVSVTDWDHDGDLDLWVVNRNGPRLRFFRNDNPSGGKSVALMLKASGGNRDALGARVELTLAGPGARPILRTLHAGEGYLAQSSKWLHFGLGPSPSPDAVSKVVVRWPGGKAEEFIGLRPGGRYELAQGSGVARPLPARAPVSLAAKDLREPPPEERARIVLSAPALAPLVSLRDGEGRVFSLEGERAGSLVTLWDAGCAACDEQLASLARAAEGLRAAGVRVVAVNVGGGEAAQALAHAVRAAGYPFEAGTDAGDLPDALDVLQRKVLWIPRRIPLPSTFVIDGDGLVPVLYKGPVDPRRVLEDLPALRGGGEKKLALALPFPGRRQTRGGPDLFDYMDGVAEAYVEAGHNLEAIAYYSKVLRIQPGRKGTHARLGIALAAEGRVDEAIEHHRKGLELEPDNAGALNNLGFALAGQGKLDEAIPLYRRALEIEPANVSALNNLGSALSARGDPQEAMALFRKALEAEPDNAPAHNNLALALSRLGRDDEAMEHYGVVLASDPDNVVVRINMGLALLRKGRLEEAIASFSRAAELKPGHAESQYHLGVALLRAGRAPEAARRLEEALRLRPGYGQAAFYHSLALVKQGRAAEAAARFAEAARLPEGSPEASEKLAWILATHEDPLFRDAAAAVALAEAACGRPGAAASCLDTLAAAYAESGRFDDAVRTARKAEEAAGAAGDEDRTARIRERISLYQAGRPFRDAAARRP
ncbi:MAG TPA: tetratricopeptide repeat protein, partial [Candidatus Polarisedimenticolia bacterium]|nr:tetratricopeptide repeat protein [Candidatus Polarisedimenticolia bacterium]